MSDKPRFSFPRIRQATNAQPAEVDLLLNLSSSALMVIDPRRLTIQQVNQSAIKLTGYDPEEIITLSLHELFLDWNDQLLPVDKVIPARTQSHSIEQAFIIKCKDGSKKSVSIKYWILSSDKKTCYLVLEPINKSTRDHSGSAKSVLLPESGHRSVLIELVEAIENKDINHALANILSLSRALSGAQVQAIYLNQPDLPQLDCIAWLGDADWLPEKLLPQELIQSKSGQFWYPGKRIITTLNRAAQAGKQSYMTSFRIGQLNATSGLYVLAGKDPPDEERIIESGQAIATLINHVIMVSALQSQHVDTQNILTKFLFYDKVLQEHIIEGCLIISPDFKIQTINQAAINILGYDPAQVKDQPLENVLIGTETLQTALGQMRTGQGRLEPIDVRLYRRSGEAFLAHLCSYPIYVNGDLDRILILLEDLTEQEFISEQTKQLEQRAILGEVTAVFAHEVRNPINNISTGLELISLNLPPNDPNHETVLRLMQDCDRLAELMKSVLAFSRPADYTLSQVQIEPFLQNLFERMRPRMERVNVHGTLQVEPGCPPVMGSPRALEQVFVNLIINAIQAMSENGGQLILRAQRAQNMERPRVRSRYSSSGSDTFVEISVIDTGPGIPLEVQERIFQPFFTTSSAGTGLGLAICKRIVTAHHGSIKLTSVPGGTVFQVFLPPG